MVISKINELFLGYDYKKIQVNIMHISYQHFLKVIVDDDNRKEWTVFDAGPKTVKCPVIFLPPASGSADVFFKQLVPLASVGYRLISVCFLLVRLRAFRSLFLTLFDVILVFCNCRMKVVELKILIMCSLPMH